MAEYFKVPFSNQQNYIEIKFSHSDGATETNYGAGNAMEIICCVDTSGSMSGSPIHNVCEVLRDIYQRTKKDYRLFTFNTETDTRRTLKTLYEQTGDLKADGGTSFACIFNAIKDYLLQNSSAKKALTFIFMTDGDDNQPNSPILKKSIEMLKLVLSGMTNVCTLKKIFGVS
jgi:predicted metal-dependent peptidase